MQQTIEFRQKKMAIGRVIKEIKFTLFYDFLNNIAYDRSGWQLELFLQIPNLVKVDILECFEYVILDLATGPFREDNGIRELDSQFLEYPRDILDKNLLENDTKPNYASEYINTIGQLFLAGYIEFGMCGLQDKEANLLSNQKEDKYQAWIYFRDNFFYTNAYNRDMIEVRTKYKDMSDDDYIYSTWDTPQFWDKYRFWVSRTPKGTKYFNEILAPKFYNKYKDLEVEIDDKGNIIKWIGQINR